MGESGLCEWRPRCTFPKINFEWAHDQRRVLEIAANSPSVLWAGGKILNTEFTESTERKEAAEIISKYLRDATLKTVGADCDAEFDDALLGPEALGPAVF
jgi:hypothetical protein